MALELDAEVAGASANSYLTVAEADELAAADAILGSKWLSTPEDERARCLVAATRDCERFKGDAGPAWSTTQARRFPRTVDAVAGVPFLPRPLRQATYEQAAHLLANAGLIRDAQARRAQGTLSQQDANGGWTAALDPRFGRYAPGMIEALAEITAVVRHGGRRIVAVPMGTSL